MANAPSIFPNKRQRFVVGLIQSSSNQSAMYLIVLLPGLDLRQVKPPHGKKCNVLVRVSRHTETRLVSVKGWIAFVNYARILTTCHQMY